ncbi:hypothetical protein FLM48_11895 [Shewanella sp. Scap07]|uniref:hypothetical protein n=1 Tax=Shewanella sp. Scap07 TaxID=2589987 RepID=UPI0015BEB803|nr:hypothetical protein [Shewanella sp. Scap07]QLE85708.1 hypothetical protein FLM48_11895 [Shewanella sp. Scap07]
MLIIFINGCAATNENSIDESMIELRRDALSKIDVLACLDKGGVIQSVCKFGMPSCVVKYMDAGKTCSDNSECAGECRIEDEFVEVGTRTTGFCSVDSDPCGCFQLITNGKAEHAVCAD